MKKSTRLILFRIAYTTLILVFGVMTVNELLSRGNTASPSTTLCALIILCTAFAPIDILLRSTK